MKLFVTISRQYYRLFFWRKTVIKEIPIRGNLKLSYDDQSGIASIENNGVLTSFDTFAPQPDEASFGTFWTAFLAKANAAIASEKAKNPQTAAEFGIFLDSHLQVSGDGTVTAQAVVHTEVSGIEPPPPPPPQ